MDENSPNGSEFPLTRGSRPGRLGAGRWRATNKTPFTLSAGA